MGFINPIQLIDSLISDADELRELAEKGELDSFVFWQRYKDLKNITTQVAGLREHIVEMQEFKRTT